MSILEVLALIGWGLAILLFVIWRDTEHYYRAYALQAVPKCLARFDKDDENETIELVKYYQYQGKECCYTI